MDQNYKEDAALPVTILHKSDNVHRTLVHGISTAPRWNRGQNGLALGMRRQFMKEISGKPNYVELDITVGLPIGEGVEDMWQFVCCHGPEMIKAHYALWARWYEDDGAVGEYIIVDISQFCEDIGYKRHHHGAFRREHKQKANELLRVLTTLEISATFQPPGRNKPAQRLRGPLWARGLVGEQEDQYSDLFGSDRVGTPDLWEPVAFSFAPGPWFSNDEWRRYSQYVGKVSGALLQLANDKDQWAIRIGGYLATLMRTNRYASFPSAVETILERCGLAQSGDEHRRSGEIQIKFERAMDRLCAVGFILGWEYKGPAAVELGDPDDQDQLIEYYKEKPSTNRRGRNTWWTQVVMITPPFPDDESRLASARAESIEKAR